MTVTKKEDMKQTALTNDASGQEVKYFIHVQYFYCVNK